jgi:hypothetical protein
MAPSETALSLRCAALVTSSLIECRGRSSRGRRAGQMQKLQKPVSVPVVQNRGLEPGDLLPPGGNAPPISAPRRAMARSERRIIRFSFIASMILSRVAVEAISIWAVGVADLIGAIPGNALKSHHRGRRIMVIPKLPKLEPWVRFPSPAPILPQRQVGSRCTKRASAKECFRHLCNGRCT